MAIASLVLGIVGSVLAGVLAFGALTGCGSSAENASQAAQDTQAAETTEQTQEMIPRDHSGA